MPQPLADWRHQREAAEFIERLNGRGMLGMEMRTGKTRVALSLALCNDARAVLVLCPHNVVPVWPRQLALHYPDAPFVISATTRGTCARRAQDMARALANAEHTGRPFLCVVNYEAFPARPLFEWLGRQEWDWLFMDEAHHLKAVNGQRSKAAARLAAVIPNKVALTGTPCPHSPLDVWAQFRAVNPAVWGSSYHRFRNRYAVMGGYQQHEVVAYQNLAEFNARLSQHCFRVRTADVLDMPETLDVTRYVELSPATRKVYDTFQRDLVADIGTGVVTASNALVKLLRLSQIAGGHTKDTISEAEVTLSREKADDLKEFLSELTWWEEGGVHKPEPVVVFCRFIPDLANVRMVCKELGLSYLECSGRHKEQHEWRAGRGTVLGVQLEAGGEGEDFTRAAYHVFYSNSYSLGTYEQCRARGTGSEQRRNLTYVHIVAQDTIDEVVYAALEKREEVVRFAVDAMRPEKRVRKATPQEQLVYA